MVELESILKLQQAPFVLWGSSLNSHEISPFIGPHYKDFPIKGNNTGGML